MKKEKAFASGKLSRALKTGAIATQVGIQHLGYVSKKTLSSETAESQKEAHEAKIGKIIFDGLSQLKGTALKASQLLSLEADLLPEGIRKELTKGCYQVPPINRAHIRKIFLNEFGQPASELFDAFDSNAFAAASLGQVHKASSQHGETFAVKVQYPGIAESIKSDIKLLSIILRGLELSTTYLPNRKVLDTTIEEISHCLQQEINYEQERKNTQWFSENLKIENVKVPKVFNEFSSKRIITFEFLDGLHIDQWLETNPSQEQRNKIGELIFKIFLKSAFELKVLHSDPHIGNYLVLQDQTIGFLDFGCVKHLEETFPKDMLALMGGLLVNDQKKVLEAYKKLKVLAPDLTQEEYNEKALPYLTEIQQWFITPFTEEEYDFTKLPKPPTLNSREHKQALTYLNHLRKDQLYFDRTYFGVYKLLKKLEATVNCKSLFAEFI